MPNPQIARILWEQSDAGLNINLVLVVLHVLTYLSNDIRHDYEPIHEDEDYQCLIHALA